MFQSELQQAILDHLRVGQERSMVEIGVELGVPYDQLAGAVQELLASEALTKTVPERGEALLRLGPKALTQLHEPIGASA